MERSRIFRRRGERAPGEVSNDGTIFLASWESYPTPDFKERFLQHYEAIRALREGQPRPGVVIAAIGKDDVEASAYLAVQDHGINTAIIGRHDEADLFLSQDPRLSLRHSAVIVYPRRENGAVRFRLLDLRSATAFVDERGLRLEALEAEGTVFVGCGAYALLVLTVGPGQDPWPENPELGWKQIPERVYLDEVAAEPSRWPRGVAQRERSVSEARLDLDWRERTLVQPVLGPVRAQRQLTDQGEDAVGEFSIESPEGRTTILLGRRAAREGVLLGRYERCDTEGLPVLSDTHISRVHVLVIEIGGRLYAVDTASKNGIWASNERLRVSALTFGQTLKLGDSLATLEWRYVH